MRKVFKLGVAGVAVVLAAAALLLPYYFGGKAEASLAKQYQLLAQSPMVEVLSRQYERRWFSSTETMTIKLKEDLINGLPEDVVENIRQTMGEGIQITNHIKHGPFVGGFSLARAKVDSTIAYPDLMNRGLLLLFTDKTPLVIHQTLGLFGGGTINIDSPDFDFKGLSDTNIKWQGFQFVVDYKGNFDEMIGELTMPGMVWQMSNQSSVSYDGFQYQFSGLTAPTGLWMGQNQLDVKRFAVTWGEEDKAKVDELLGMVNKLQFGALIKPILNSDTKSIVVDDIHFSSDMAAADSADFVKATGQVRFAKATLGRDVYGPLEVEVVGDHLHAASMAAWTKALKDLSAKALNGESYAEEMLKLINNEVLAVLVHNPQISLKTFKLTTPQGLLSAAGHMNFKGVEEADMSNFASFLRKVDVKMDIDVPQAFLGDMAAAQAANLFDVGEGDDKQEQIRQIEETTKYMVDSMIINMREEGYLTITDKVVNLRVRLQDGNLLFNDKLFDAGVMLGSNFDEDTEEHAGVAPLPGAAAGAPGQQGAPAATPEAESVVPDGTEASVDAVPDAA
ncbi:MAG: YdgA family protein [Neisseriaceae bacterium]|nr:YdgA family protein [Neisseriaceae bacterium]